MATSIITANDVDTSDFGCRGGKFALNPVGVLRALDSNSDGKIDPSLLPVDAGNLTYNGATGELTHTNSQGATQTVNLPLENFLSSASVAGTILTLTLDDSTTVDVDLANLVDMYALAITDGDTVDLTLTGDGSTGNPWTITAEAIVDPNAANVLTSSASGLLVDWTTIRDNIESDTFDCSTLTTIT